MNPDFKAREYFLILLLKKISQHLSGRSFAVKGGICLRFFHQSLRISEDMDLDVSGVPAFKLSNIVEKCLNSKSTRLMLDGAGIAIVRWSAPKQTATTQRWKINLSLNNRGLSTKLDFSRRKTKINFNSGIPDNNLLTTYKVLPFVSQYYAIEEMIEQKIQALASPQRTAARDLFDLNFLVSKRTCQKIDLPDETLLLAIEKLSTISPVDFKNQVLPFLPSDLSSLYLKNENYNKMREEVEEFLMGNLKT